MSFNLWYFNLYLIFHIFYIKCDIYELSIKSAFTVFSLLSRVIWYFVLGNVRRQFAKFSRIGLSLSYFPVICLKFVIEKIFHVPQLSQVSLTDLNSLLNSLVVFNILQIFLIGFAERGSTDLNLFFVLFDSLADFSRVEEKFGDFIEAIYLLFKALH